MSQFDDMIGKMKSAHEVESQKVAAEKAAASQEYNRVRDIGIAALQSQVAPLLDDAARACERQGIRAIVTDNYAIGAKPEISFQCKGPKPRYDGTTYEVEGAKVDFTHDGEVLRVMVRRWPHDQKGPSEFGGPPEDSIPAGIKAALESYFTAIAPDKT